VGTKFSRWRPSKTGAQRKIFEKGTIFFGHPVYHSPPQTTTIQLAVLYPERNESSPYSHVLTNKHKYAIRFFYLDFNITRTPTTRFFGPPPPGFLNETYEYVTALVHAA
jgi:hypothetical protein